MHECDREDSADFNQVSKETRRKVAEAMAGNVGLAMVDPKSFSLLPDEPASSNGAATMVPSTIPNMFVPNVSNAVVLNRNPNMILPNVSYPVVLNAMPNCFCPKCRSRIPLGLSHLTLPTQSCRTLIRTRPLSPSPCTLSTTRSLWVCLVIVIRWPFQCQEFFFNPLNVQGNVLVNVSVNVSMQEPAPRQFASQPATGCLSTLKTMPPTLVCESQVSGIAANEPPT